MSKKELLQRIKSLEDYFGLAFITPDNKDDSAEHIIKYTHGKAAKLDELIEDSR
jgi:hypothetical protein